MTRKFLMMCDYLLPLDSIKYIEFFNGVTKKLEDFSADGGVVEMEEESIYFDKEDIPNIRKQIEEFNSFKYSCPCSIVQEQEKLKNELDIKI